MLDICNEASQYLASIKTAIDALDAAVIDSFGELLFAAWRDGRRVFVFGNGGSAATASHAVADFVKTAAVAGHPCLKAMCLTDNIATLTAVANDVSYDDVFLYPIQAFSAAGDIAVAISASGNSTNVIRACAWATENGLRIVGLTGCSGGALGSICHTHIHVQSSNYGVIEDLHLAVGHMAAQRLKTRILEVKV